MTTDHPQFALMCEVCFRKLTPEQCVMDTDGQRWDICQGLCATQAGIDQAICTSAFCPTSDSTPHPHRPGCPPTSRQQ